MVTINNKNITKAEVANAASSAGLSAAQLKQLAQQLEALAHNMNFGDGQALNQLATLIGEAASNAGQATHQGGGFNPSSGATAPPGT